MIVTEQKPYEEVLKILGNRQRIFIVGCGSCATAWKTGGEPEVKEMAEKLTQSGKTITGWVVSEEGCDERKIKREFRAHKDQIAQADVILSMACGAGGRTIALAQDDKPVYPALNSLYLARLERLTKTEEACVLCGECILDRTGGICPMATCPKELLNGPCGGYKNGKCEVDPDRDCTWVQIYNRLQRFGETEHLRTIESPKDNSKRKHPRRVEKAAA